MKDEEDERNYRINFIKDAQSFEDTLLEFVYKSGETPSIAMAAMIQLALKHYSLAIPDKEVEVFIEKIGITFRSLVGQREEFLRRKKS